MPSDFEMILKKKISSLLIERGYNISEHPTVDVENNTVTVDLYARKDDNIYLIEINNGVRVGMNNIAQLLIYSNALRNADSIPVHEIIITDYLDKIDPEIKKVTDKEKIKIFTYEQLKNQGFLS